MGISKAGKMMFFLCFPMSHQQVFENCKNNVFFLEHMRCFSSKSSITMKDEWKRMCCSSAQNTKGLRNVKQTLTETNKHVKEKRW